MSVPERPPPPVVGKVTHYALELYWDDALDKASQGMPKGDNRMRVCVQEKDRSGGWGVVYTGYSSKYLQEGLEPITEYTYRLRFTNDQGNSEWSPSVKVSTTKQPKTGEDIHRAIVHNNKEDLIKILECGDIPDCDIPDRFGHTPLMQSAQKGERTELMEILIEHGADVNFQNEAGKTALMLAAFAGMLESVKLLINFGAKFGLRDKGGCTALHWAMDSGHLEMIQFILTLREEPVLDKEIDINCKDLNGWTPLLRVASVGGNSDVAQLILRNGADINVRDRDGKTALMIAVVNGHQDLVNILLEKDADFSIRNEYGKTAYDMAVSLDKRISLL